MNKFMKQNLLEVIDRVRIDAVPDLEPWLQLTKQDVQEAKTFEDECKCAVELMDVVRDYGYAMYTMDRMYMTDASRLAKRVLDSSEQFCMRFSCDDVLDKSGLYCCATASDGILSYCHLYPDRSMEEGGCVGENAILVANDLCECQCADEKLPRNQPLTAFGVFVYVECDGDLGKALDKTVNYK